ncbi:MAG: uracil phosphoribosyltransferase, partial [Bacteroidales bacterium]
PMLATAASMVMTVKHLMEYGSPSSVHIATIIASRQGVAYLKRHMPVKYSLWVGDIDEELTAKSYIVPGLGDAGDLAFGTKQD